MLFISLNRDCHKAVLAARSDVFAAMFRHKEMKENVTNQVEIKDTDADVLEDLLRFMYSNKVNNLESNASRLLIAANKYNITSLKVLCEEFLSSNINVHNAANLLQLGYLHEAKILRLAAIEFITNHLPEVIKTSDWELISKTESVLFNELLTSFAEKAKKK